MRAGRQHFMGIHWSQQNAFFGLVEEAVIDQYKLQPIVADGKGRCSKTSCLIV